MDLRNLATYETTAQQQRDGEETVVGDYTLLRTIGRGTFGRVALAQKRSTGKLAALKLLPRGDFVERYGTYVAREILHQASLRHPFVVNLKEVILTQQSLVLAMEYASGGTLLQYMKTRGRLMEAEARWIFQQLIIGLAYCHARGVANRDLKLDNLLLDRAGATTNAEGDWPLLKICDFGYSKHEANSTAKTSVGTPVYMAPEVIGGVGKYSAKRADIWSCGVILYVLLFGCYPFNPDSKDYAMAIVHGRWTIPPDSGVSAEALNLLRQMMAFDPLLRIDIPGILADPWFQRALPQGAGTMNDLYLANAPQLDPFVPVIKTMVQAAETVGAPGDAPQVVTLEAAAAVAMAAAAQSAAATTGGGGPG